jgi:GNAT superfamily N-acetyltransferase
MIRRMTRQDLDTVLSWAAAEGWNPGQDDAAAFLAADPDGFFIDDRDGQPVAAISVVNHDDRFAFLGLYLCLPAWRGKGIGLALWQAALQHAGGRCVGLDGVAAQQANYAKSGFVAAGSTLRLQGPVLPPTGDSRAVTRHDVQRMQTLDRRANGYGRPRFLTAWLTDTATRRSVTDGTGFATARLCRTGCKIGPVMARDTACALTLIADAAAALSAETVIIDVPKTNTALIAALSGLGFTETFRTARMYRGAAPVAGPDLHAVGTLELG